MQPFLSHFIPEQIYGDKKYSYILFFYCSYSKLPSFQWLKIYFLTFQRSKVQNHFHWDQIKVSAWPCPFQKLQGKIFFFFFLFYLLELHSMIFWLMVPSYTFKSCMAWYNICKSLFLSLCGFLALPRTSTYLPPIYKSPCDKKFGFSRITQDSTLSSRSHIYKIIFST